MKLKKKEEMLVQHFTNLVKLLSQQINGAMELQKKILETVVKDSTDQAQLREFVGNWSENSAKLVEQVEKLLNDRG